MATVNPTPVRLRNGSAAPAIVVTWANIGDSDTCTAYDTGGFSGRSVQVSGTFGSATIVLQGSNDGSNYVTLTDPQGNAISKTSAAFEQIEEMTRYLKPGTSGGTNSNTTVTVFLVQK